MSWSNPMSWPAGLFVLSSHMNTHVRDNFNAVHEGAIAIADQDTNDFIFASSPTQLGRLPITGVGLGKMAYYNGTAWTMVTPYPVGRIVEFYNQSDNPSTLMGFGTWTFLGAGRVSVGFDATQEEFDSPTETGGAKTHTLTTPEIPAHTHTTPIGTLSTGPAIDQSGASLRTTAAGVTTSSAGGGGAHNNLQPYLIVYRWVRTA